MVITTAGFVAWVRNESFDVQIDAIAICFVVIILASHTNLHPKCTKESRTKYG